MTQVDIAVFVDPETGMLDEQKLTSFITRYRIGSLFNTPFAGHSGRWDGARASERASLPETTKRPLFYRLVSSQKASRFR